MAVEVATFKSGTSRMNREVHVRICERLGCKSLGRLGHREVESEGPAEKLRAGIDGAIPTMKPVGQRGARSIGTMATKALSFRSCGRTHLWFEGWNG